MQVSDALALALRRRANHSGITQTALSELSGISQSSISKVFRLESKLSVAHFVELCDAMGTDPLEVIAEAVPR